MLHVFLTGAAVSGSLIVAIESQNAFLLKCGLKKQYAWSVATVCFIGDIFLISAGVLGVGSLLYSQPLLKDILTILGILFLLWYGFQSVKSAWIGTHTIVMENIDATYNWLKIVLTAFALTFLNPHVYLDTVVILGGITAPMADNEKLWFLVGALVVSFLWFYGLVYLSRKLVPLFEKPNTWKLLDSIITFIMFSIAIKLTTTLG
ncbi:TPA: amino acid transporter [Vibrio parahaemolyticus]|uniref:LysE/ArgO family amino acid transporter n=1 Tax=Vibrio harveyi group TaxID=717610 RepID=UPI001B81DBD4|nr:amino acid transporter [Vibrio parahaemolyticus]